jgi:hypothetical protein
MSSGEEPRAAREGTDASVPSTTNQSVVSEALAPDAASVVRDAPPAPSEPKADAGGEVVDPTAESPESQPDTPAATEPKLVRRVVVSYQLGWLPGEWLQTWRRLDRMFARANLKVKATLAPLEDLPADTDILVVPPELRDAARAAVPVGTPILVTPASAAAGAFGDLVNRLEAGTTFTAEKFDQADLDKPRILSYRGQTLLD